MIIVTGATGLVGSHLIYELIKSGNRVKAIKRQSSNTDIVRKIFSYYSSNYQALFEKIEWINADLLNYQSLLEAMADCEYVYHAAALVSFAPVDKQIMLKTNITGTANIVNACIEKKIKKLCYVSSIAALGRTNNGDPITEETKWQDSENVSTYSKSKYLSEQEVWRGINEGLDAVIVNPTVILGPGNWEAGSPALFNTVWKGLKFFTTGITGFVDVRDVTAIMIRLMNMSTETQRYLINSENYCYQDLLSAIAEGLEKPEPKFRASRLIAEIAWRMECIRCKFTHRKPLITKETTTSARKKNTYSNEKIINLFSYKFISVKDSIKFTAEILFKEKNKSACVLQTDLL